MPPKKRYALVGTGSRAAMYIESLINDYRDGCVFSAGTDIQDTLHFIAFNDSRGRLEHTQRETASINGDGSVPGELLAQGTTTRVIPHFQSGYNVPIWKGGGGHGGGDPRMLDDIFNPNPQPDAAQPIDAQTFSAGSPREFSHKILTASSEEKK